MRKFFYLPPNAKIVKWTKNSNAKSTNLTFESTKSQWQTPPWLNEQIKPQKALTDPLKTRGLCVLKARRFFRIDSRFIGKNRDFL